MSTRRKVGIAGAVAGVVAVGAATAVVAERYAVRRARRADDPLRGEPFFGGPADRELSVIADDGVPLHVVEVGPEDAPVTVVFCHGYTLQLASWFFQRRDLAADNPGRLVFWDQRSHGRSGRSAHRRSTIDQLGRDLFAVLEDRAPTGKVVLVGHSMGGMTIMALADQHPELFGSRVVGVALIATSTGFLGEVRVGVPTLLANASRRILPMMTAGVRAQPRAFEGPRRLGTDLAFLMTRRGGFGGKDVPPALVEFTDRMIAATPVDVIAEFFDTFADHDKLAALQVLNDVETLVLCGTEDRITPIAHSRAIAAALPHGQLVELEGAGHMVMLEREALVTLQLRALIKRATRARRRSNGVTA